jgi:hypothetical protein
MQQISSLLPMIMKNIRTIQLTLLILLAITITPALNAQNLVTGFVFEDLNENGEHDANESGIGGVPVSNGIDVVLTGSDGAYSLPVVEDLVLFVTKPAEYRFPLNGQNLPQFYYIHRPDGSPELEYPGSKPTGPLPESVNFGLIPSQKKCAFRAIIFGDPQPLNHEQLSFYRDEIVSELADTAGDLIIVLGDIMYDDLSLYERYNALMAATGRPVVNVMGNHDLNFDTDGNRFARETFIRHYGPTYHAFEEGDIHFIVIDNTNYLGLNDEGNPQYNGRIDDTQMSWIENHLQYADKNKRIVFLAHIPLITPGLEEFGGLNTSNLERLLGLVEGFDHVHFLASHMHTNFHTFMGPDFGRLNPEPVHHVITAAASGSWWSGPLNESGVPFTIQRDGVPNGYHVFDFNGTEYIETYKAAQHDRNDQMRIEIPDASVTVHQIRENGILVNVFNGSEKTEVHYRLNENEWKPMNRLPLHESAYFRQYREMYDDHIPGWIQPIRTTHLWHAELPDFEGPGTHLLTVQVRDAYGRDFTHSKVVEVSD